MGALEGYGLRFSPRLMMRLHPSSHVEAEAVVVAAVHVIWRSAPGRDDDNDRFRRLPRNPRNAAEIRMCPISDTVEFSRRINSVHPAWRLFEMPRICRAALSREEV